MSTTLKLDELNPLLKAYALGYASSVLPRLPGTVRKAAHAPSLEQKRNLFQRLLLSPVGIDRFPTACAIIIGGSTILPRRSQKLLDLLSSGTTGKGRSRFCTILRKALLPLSSFGCAWLAFGLLNKRDSWSRNRAASSVTDRRLPNEHVLPPEGHKPRYSGKTIDLTLFAFCRAVDAVIVAVWVETRNSKLHPDTLAPRLSYVLRVLADPVLFAASSTIIMWSWFFEPERLPSSYNHWISRIAQIDSRLLNALRLCRQGDFVYGSCDTEDANLPSLCEELNMPEQWGNPAVTIPVPCELYHCGAGKSCEIHACKRFGSTFTSAMRLYLPLQLLGLIRKSKRPAKRIPMVLKNAARSSAFLATFVTLFYYFVCLARTRVGPKLMPSFSPQRWDSGLCVLSGCLACGWSIMLEESHRRQEVAHFVAPRAFATLLPRIYDRKYQRREQLAFACSVASLLTVAQHEGQYIRGVFGGVLGGLLS